MIFQGTQNIWKMTNANIYTMGSRVFSEKKDKCSQSGMVLNVMKFKSTQVENDTVQINIPLNSVFSKPALEIFVLKSCTSNIFSAFGTPFFDRLS